MGKVVNVECALRDIFHVSHRSSQNLKGILLLLYLSKSERPYVRKLLIQFECNAGIRWQVPQAAVGGIESKGFLYFLHRDLQLLWSMENWAFCAQFYQ